jgi:ATP-binding cassette subfamily B protein
VRGLAVLLRPYRARVLAMFAALLLATGATLAPPPLAKVAIDDGITPGDETVLYWSVAAFLASALLLWAATWVQTYLVGCSRTCASRSLATCSSCRSASIRGAGRGC